MLIVITMEKEQRNITIVEEKARNIRLDKNLTQKEFGDILGISKSYVSDIENGYTGLTIDHINKICNFADVTFDYMFDFCKSINQNVIKVEKINLKIVGSNIKTIRKDLNYTQEKLASKLNISRTLITHYEKGIRKISTADLKQICEISGYSADWCVGKLSECIKREQTKKIKPKEIKELIEA